MLALFCFFYYFYRAFYWVFAEMTVYFENTGFFLKSMSSLKVLLDIIMSASFFADPDVLCVLLFVCAGGFLLLDPNKVFSYSSSYSAKKLLVDCFLADLLLLPKPPELPIISSILVDCLKLFYF